MSGRHRARASKSNVVIGSIVASVGVSSVLAAAIVELVSPEAPSNAAAAPVAPQQAVTQEGKVVAVAADSLTALSADGVTQTYTLTPSTAKIIDGGQTSSPAASFAVNDEVTVVGTRQGASVVATAVVDRSAQGAAGRPMDFAV